MPPLLSSHPRIVFSGQSYSHHHLMPFVSTLTGHGKDGADLRVRVWFSSHVYSRVPDAMDVEALFKDENNKPRAFCPIRHHQSQRLPLLCANMLQHNYPTWISQDRGTSSNMTVTDLQPRTGSCYAIFYSVWPARSTDVEVEMLVKSAYEKYIDMSRHRKREKVVQVVKRCYYLGKPQP